jgi:hypothetical protein
MRKWIAAAIWLFAGLVPAMASSPYPNTYAISHSYRFDRTVGASGTLYITATITGAMSPNPGIPCTTQHTPSVQIKKPNGTMTTRVLGPATSACTNMGWSTTFTFDLANEGCTNNYLFGGECVFESQGNITCPLMGLFWIKWKNIQFEVAFTSSKVTQSTSDNPASPGPWLMAPNCSPRSLTPGTNLPDWDGSQGTDDYGTGYWREDQFMYREVDWGQSFTGVWWHEVFPYGPAWEDPAPNPPPDCTNYDLGIKPVA